MIKPLLRKMGFIMTPCARSYWDNSDATNKNVLDIEDFTEEAVAQFIKDHGYPEDEQIYYYVFDSDAETYLFTKLPEPSEEQLAKKSC